MLKKTISQVKKLVNIEFFRKIPKGLFLVAGWILGIISMLFFNTYGDLIWTSLFSETLDSAIKSNFTEPVDPYMASFSISCDKDVLSAYSDRREWFDCQIKNTGKIAWNNTDHQDKVMLKIEDSSANIFEVFVNDQVIQFENSVAQYELETVPPEETLDIKLSLKPNEIESPISTESLNGKLSLKIACSLRDDCMPENSKIINYITKLDKSDLNIVIMNSDAGYAPIFKGIKKLLKPTPYNIVKAGNYGRISKTTIYFKDEKYDVITDLQQFLNENQHDFDIKLIAEYQNDWNDNLIQPDSSGNIQASESDFNWGLSVISAARNLDEFVDIIVVVKN